MKQIFIIILTLCTVFSYAQKDKKAEAELLAQKKANDYVYQGNELVDSDNYISAEMEYRKAISEQPSSVAGTYNLGNSYYQKGNFEEALYRHEQASKSATTKAEKHKAFHNIGNILMKSNECKLAVEAYKNALRNNPNDEETRYNFALAKECAAQQQEDQQQEDQQDEDKKDEDKDKEDEDNKDKEGEDKEDQDKKEGDDKKDEEGKPKDDKKEDGKGDDKKEEQKKPKQQPGQLSPQQIKSLLEAMNNQEQKVQEKMNAEKQKGAKVKTEKDW